MQNWVDTLPVAGVVQTIHIEGLDHYLLDNKIFQKQGNTLKHARHIKCQKLNVNSITFYKINNDIYTEVNKTIKQVNMMQVLTERSR